jgi:chromosome partitioning protein
MKVITLLNEKGGVGKTTLANTIGCGLAIKGHRILLIDADPQANLTTGLGLQPEPKLYDLLVRNARFSEVVKAVPAEVYQLPEQPPKGKLFIIPGHRETRSIPNQIDNAWILADRLAVLKDDIDAVIFDTPPTPSLFHAAIYLATDYIIFPTELEFYSFSGLVSSIQSRQGFNSERVRFGHTEINILGIIPNKLRAATLQHQDNLKSLLKQFGNLVWPALPQTILWGEAAQFKRSIFNYAPDSNAAKAGWDIIRRVEGAMQHVT